MRLSRRWRIFSGAFVGLVLTVLCLERLDRDTDRRYRQEHPEEAARRALEIKMDCREIALTTIESGWFEHAYRFSCRQIHPAGASEPGRPRCEGTITVDHHFFGHSSYSMSIGEHCV